MEGVKKEKGRRDSKKEKGRRDSACCTRRKLGLMPLHAAAPKHPHSSCWSVSASVCEQKKKRFLVFIKLVFYLHFIKCKSVSFTLI